MSISSCRHNITCKVGLKLKKNIDKTIVSNIAMEVEYTWKIIRTKILS